MVRTDSPSTTTVPWLQWLAAIALVIVTFFVFRPSLHHDFVNLDDPDYVQNNPMVQMGLSGETVKWAFTKSHSSNWHPLTWLSHALDWQIHGDHPGGHHQTNILLHVLNTLLLLLVLNKMTGAFWRSFVVTALFALHPLHVESVAWVSERKDVLSTLFWLLTMIFYVRYAQGKQPSGARRGTLDYSLALFFFACGLMSKPMVVTLPCVLLLLDVWPLRRVSGLQRQNGQTSAAGGWGKLFAEKIPFFLLTILASAMTVWAQRSSGSVISVEHLPVRFRLENAVFSYMEYLRKMFWPADLAVFYPYTAIPAWKVGLSLLLLVGLSVLAFRMLRRQPVLFTGWFWYVGTLVPVIGIIQVGNQALADRYTYIPLIGIFVALVWGVSDLFTKLPHRKMILGVTSLLMIGGCAAMTHRQVRHWEDSKTLFSHAAAVTPRNYLAVTALAVEKQAKGDFHGATNDLAQVLEWKPDYPEGHQTLGNVLLAAGKHEDALASYRKALAVRPGNPEAHIGAGLVYLSQNQVAEADKEFREALRLNPNLARAHVNVGLTSQRQGRLEEAIEHYRAALKINPNLVAAYQNLGLALSEQKKFDEAIATFKQALEINPTIVPVQILRGGLLLDQGNLSEAERHFRRVIELVPDNIQAHLQLAMCLERSGRVREAVAEYKKALELRGDLPEALNNLAWLLATGPEEIRDGAKAVELAERACELTKNKISVMVGTLGAAYAEAGLFQEAIKAAERAREMALRDGNEAGAATNEKLIALYKEGKTARDLK